MDIAEKLSEIQIESSKPRGWFRRALRTTANAFSLVWKGLCWLGLELSYWVKLFLFISRRFLQVEVILALVGAYAFFGWILSDGLVQNQRDLLHYCHIYFTILTVLMTMNLIPRERDQETLEILWSQPTRRGTIIILQLIAVTVWQLVLCLFIVFFFSQYTAYHDGQWAIPILVVSNAFIVGAITLTVATFCRHGMATGLVSLLILGVHFLWLQELGPINLFMNPIPYPNASGEPVRIQGLWSNRIFAIAFCGFVIDYLLRRLRRTSEWFT